MKPCSCHERHERKRIVLTGGPGAGKTALLELVQQSFCEHMRVLPESASILFTGGFPRGASPAQERAVQRAIYRVQVELERCADDDPRAAVVLCDRGTIDGVAYWPPGPPGFFADNGTTREAELARYHAVLHLRTPPADRYNRRNPARTETAEQAARIDAAIAQAWSGHPRVHVVDAAADFLTKAARAVELLSREVPDCCRTHL